MKEEILDRRVLKDETPVKRMLNPPPQRKNSGYHGARIPPRWLTSTAAPFIFIIKMSLTWMDRSKNELIEEVEFVLTHHPVPELVAPLPSHSQNYFLLYRKMQSFSILIREKRWIRILSTAWKRNCQR